MDNYIFINKNKRMYQVKLLLQNFRGSKNTGLKFAIKKYQMVFDRKNNKLIREKIPKSVKIAMKILHSKRTPVILLKICTKALAWIYGKAMASKKSTIYIERFVKYYKINLDEVAGIDPLIPLAKQYNSFNDFFYRKLKPKFRPISGQNDQSIIVSPCDSRVHVFNSAKNAVDIWIKGEKFSVQRMIGQYNYNYEDGPLMMCRLAIQDYHRFHSPTDGKIIKIRYIRGNYYTVNPSVIRENHLSPLSENKRVILTIENDLLGTFFLIAIGATLVGSLIISVKESESVIKGHELGYFAFGGSTIILLFPTRLKDKVKFDNDLIKNTNSRVETLVNYGEKIARII